MYNRKMMKETNENFREVFTYTNFKKTMIENQQMRAQVDEVRAENQEMNVRMIEMRSEIDQLKQFIQQNVVENH